MALKSANEKLNIGVVGVAHQGNYNLTNVATENIVALCDIDDEFLAEAKQDFPEAATYNDFRKMLERNDLDAVVVSTPDHTHAAATLLALETGHHVYCEKPLTHTISEARLVTETARKHNRVTQMGTQIHAGDNYRRVVELIRSGAIGTVREVHVWVGKVHSGNEFTIETPPVPPTVHYDLWLGPAPYRPYSPAFVPYHWRGWWQFGTGVMGDLACHHIDLSHWALNLTAPVTVESQGSPVSEEFTPEWQTVEYLYPAVGDRPAVNLKWYDGGRRPSYFSDGKMPEWGDGTLFVGEKGMLLAAYSKHVLLPEEKFADFTPPAPFIPNSIGHHAEWIEACKTGGPTTCNFDYAGNLTEAVLLGNVSYRVGRKLEWDSANLKAVNCPEADRYIHAEYRPEWTPKIG